MGNAVEIVGKVQGDLSVKVYQATDFGGSIGMAAARSHVEGLPSHDDDEKLMSRFVGRF